MGAYDGTLESFEITTGNISADCPLRSFGLHSITKVLDSLSELFYIKNIGSAHSVAIAYEKTFLCQIINNSPTVISDTVLFLNIADVIESAAKHLHRKAHGPEGLFDQGKVPEDNRSLCNSLANQDFLFL